MRLRNKRVLITGTAGGQGRAAQERFVKEGARVIGCDVQPGAAELSAEDLQAQGYDVTGNTVDLTDPRAARYWVESAADRLGGIDVLYNNASGAGFAPFGEMELDLWHHVMRVELDLIFHATRPAWEYLLDSQGAVINTGSVSGVIPTGTGQVAHAAAKGGVIAMTRALAVEGAGHGVRVNCISPGLIRSPGSDRFLTQEQRAEAVARHMIQRPGEADEVAGLAVYLACDEAKWVTGQNFVMDGGLSAGFR